MEEVILHNQLQDLYNYLDIEIEQDAEFTVHALEDLFHDTITSPVFRANYYSFLFIKSGMGQYTLDGVTREAGPHTIYFTNPGHLKSYATQVPYTGYILTLSETFLKQQVSAEVFEEFPFLLAEIIPPGRLEVGEFGEFVSLVEQIYREERGTSTYKYKIIGNLFAALLLKIKERFWQNYDPTQESDRGSNIVNEFRRELEHTYRNLDTLEHLPNVGDYAGRQHLHPNYFSTVIKSKTGKSVHTWIAEKTLAEARTMLNNPKWSIKEIAFHLKFSEPTHFSKFFKKHSQVTPNAYRKSILQA